MRKIFFVLGILVFFIGQAYADPPSAIDVGYDTTAKRFRAVIHHKVANPTKHYIRKVVISVNHKQVAEQYFTKQSSVSGQEVIFAIPSLKMGDVLEIEAFCNVGGRRSQPVKIQ